MEQEKQNTLTQEELEQLIREAEQGDDESQFLLGKYYEEECEEADIKQVVYWYTLSAEQGNVKAQHRLGQVIYWSARVAEYDGRVTCYANDAGIEQSYEQAIYWFTKAAEQDYPQAQCSLGLFYAEGKGAEQNYEQAEYWWQKAAERGLLDAIENLEILKKWYTKAAEQGDEKAKEALERLKNK